MKSIKPGRGPSKLGTVGAICVAIFGVFWCIMSGAMGAWFLIPFGLIFVGFGLAKNKPGGIGKGAWGFRSDRQSLGTRKSGASYYGTRKF